MKRKCSNCRANQSNEKCELGYKTEKIYYQPGFPINMKPLEECPKPLTYKEYIRELKK